MGRTVLLLAATALVAASAASSKLFPDRIPLPNGWQPEGIAIGNGTTFYVGSIPTGAVYRGDLRTGKGAVLVRGAPGRAATGLKHDRGRLFVAGASTGKAFVYDARSGATIRELRLATGAEPAFVNDVVVTRDAAYFTDSFRAVLYRLPLAKNGRPAAAARTLPLTGDFRLVPGEFNLNGIDATPSGDELLAVQSTTGKLFTIDPRTGATSEVRLGGATLPNADGIVLSGRTLYVVQNRLNRISVVQLRPSLASGAVRRAITSPAFRVPTTAALHGAGLYAVNARFDTAAEPSTDYDVVKVGR
jgi:sugar lactone lactonase YvrE